MTTDLTTDLSNISSSLRAAPAWQDMLPTITGTPWAMATPPEWPRAGRSWHPWAAHTCWTRGATAAPHAGLGVNSQDLAQAALQHSHPCSWRCFTPSAPLSPLHCSHSCGKLSPGKNCSQSRARRNCPEPAETRDPQIRSLVAHHVPTRRNYWYKPSFNLCSHQSTSSTSIHRQRGLLIVFCYLISPEQFKREQLPKDWPSSHGRDNPTWAGSPSLDSMLAQVQWCQYLPAPANTLRILPRAAWVEHKHHADTKFCSSFLLCFAFPSIDIKGKSPSFLQRNRVAQY